MITERLRPPDTGPIPPAPDSVYNFRMENVSTEEVEILLDRQVRPLLKIHGGGIELLEVTGDGRVSLEFQGACRGCPLKSVTYALGVRQKLLQLPGVREVRVNGVRLSDAALRRVEKFYSGYSFWVGGPG